MSARRQNTKKVAHKTDIRGRAGYWADILCQKITDSQSHRCTHDDFVCETLFSRPSHSNSIVTERKQDIGQIFYARKLQMLDRIGSPMTTLCVRPCFRDPPTKINRDKAHAGRMPRRWHTRLILEDKQDTVQIFYAKKLQMLDRIGAHMTTLCVRPCFRDPPTQTHS